MKLVIANQEEKEEVVEISLEYEGSGDIDIFANGELIAWIQKNGVAHWYNGDIVDVHWVQN